MSCQPWPLLLSLLFLLAPPTLTKADAPTSDPPGYADAIAAAIAEFAAGNIPEAREELRRAYQLFPNARTLRGLGMVEFELRNYGEAARLLEEALASEVRPLEGAMREDVRVALDRARRYLMEVHFDVVPSTATVLVDGVRVHLGPRGAVLLEVGEHAIEAQATGWARERRSIRVQGGERNIVRIVLRQLPSADKVLAVAAPAGMGPASPQASERQSTHKKWWVWTAVGLAASAGAITTLSLVRRDRESEVRAVEGTNTTGVTLHTLESF